MMIEINNLTYTYAQSERPTLHNISWRMAAGDFALLAGPSGSGKSTLLRCLRGAAAHRERGVMRGEIKLHGVGQAASLRAIGFVRQCPETESLAECVEDEVAAALADQPLDRLARRIQLEEALELLELAALRRRPLHTLSGGGSPSPIYAGRCFTISPDNNLPARVTLWALTSETPANPATYHYNAGWQALPNPATGTAGAYTWASGDTPGFSSFLLGGENEPTAVTLQTVMITSRPDNQTSLIILLITLLTALSGAWLWLSPRRLAANDSQA